MGGTVLEEVCVSCGKMLTNGDGCVSVGESRGAPTATSHRWPGWPCGGFRRVATGAASLGVAASPIDSAGAVCVVFPSELCVRPGTVSDDLLQAIKKIMAKPIIVTFRSFIMQFTGIRLDVLLFKLLILRRCERESSALSGAVISHLAERRFAIGLKLFTNTGAAPRQRACRMGNGRRLANHIDMFGPQAQDAACARVMSEMAGRNTAQPTNAQTCIAQAPFRQSPQAIDLRQWQIPRLMQLSLAGIPLRI
jgi:hypothetical protein